MIDLWLAIHRGKGLSNRRKKAIVETCDRDPRKALQQMRTAGMTGDRTADAQVARTIHKLKGSILPYDSPAYPALLREIPDPPMCLYVLGDPAYLAIPALAFVGTRRATQYGLNACRRLIQGMTGQRLCIVSGLAEGIDSCAHQAALDQGLPTAAVLGTGPDVVYPRRNRPLMAAIQQSGIVITEFDPGIRPEPFRFPIRNRLISGLSLGTVVVEARERSGSMITLRLALEQNREVFAVPGRMFDRASVSTNRRIQRGEAKLVLDAADILEEFPGFDNPSKSDRVIPDSGPGLVGLLAERPLSMDELVIRSGWPRERVLMELTVLELSGVIEKTGANLYTKRME